MDRTISNIIVNICKDLGIEYKSRNPKILSFYEDSRKLAKIYWDLKIMSDELIDIFQRHEITANNDLLKDDIDMLNKIEHDLVNAAQKIIYDEKRKAS